ncbi:MerR family transcriptional regulator [Streptomyces sp. NPDC048664]|uniref:DNA polymerase III subunit beta family protein n=1 Tax=Streptomyces sp. NPDC048664 TaxID=3154505 RepID=UPI00343DC802
MRSIGEMARDSGLSASALRFYDRAGVLVPAWVDPVTGYRWYDPEQVDEARVLGRLRRAAMPLADIRLVLAGWTGSDTELVRTLLDAHLRRLEAGVRDARGEFSLLRALLDRKENPMTSTPATGVRLSLPAPALAAALDAVRFAVSTDPELVRLCGVLFDFDGGAAGDQGPGLRVVATDRYRLAVAHAVATGGEAGGGPVQVVVPAALVDAMRALLDGDDPVVLGVEGDRVRLVAGDREAAGQCLGHGFPDYRRLVQVPAGRKAAVDAVAFRGALRAGPVRWSEPTEAGGAPCALSVLRVRGDRTVEICAEGDEGDELVGVNREFLIQALEAGGRGERVLELGAATAPLVVRGAGAGTYSLLMPVRLG